MRLTRREKAPSFSIKNCRGKETNLAEYKGFKILLSFFRGASCPFCNMRVRELIRRYDDFQEKGLEVICFFDSPMEEIVFYAGKQNTPFPIIPDPSGKMYKLYGIESSCLGMFRAVANPLKMLRVMTSGFFNMKSLSDRLIIPVDFLIDEAGFLHKVYYGKDFGDHISMNTIDEWII